MQMDDFYLFNPFKGEMHLYYTLTQNLALHQTECRSQSVCIRTASRLMMFMEKIDIFLKQYKPNKLLTYLLTHCMEQSPS